jgi:hypothetical protein
MKKLRLEEVNKRNSLTWTACNDDSRSGIWRKLFLESFGGKFTREGRYWIWDENKKQEVPRKCWIFSKENKEVRIINFLEYCKDNNLSRSAMYEVMNGKRRQYKGYTFVAEELHGIKIIRLGSPSIDNTSTEEV